MKGIMPQFPDQPTLTVWVATINALYQEELYRQPDPGGMATYLLQAADGGTAETMRESIRESPEWHYLHDTPPLPAAPSRDQVCVLQTSLQGLTYHTAQFGDIPAWFYAGLSLEDRQTAREAHKAAGDTHIPISISAAYKESGTLWPDLLKQGYDFAYDLNALRAVITPIIQEGLFVDLPLAGDGQSVSPHPNQFDYNDPVGKTYGFQWLMNEFPRIVAGLQGDGTLAKPDLTPYIIFRPGWDGVFYGWEPSQVDAFGKLFRQLLPNGYLAIEHNTGHIPCGEGGADYQPGGLMRNYDTILSEFDDVHMDSCWQIVARMVPVYHRPADQPTGDDPNPPFYLAPGTPRGPYFYVAFEPTIGGVYQWCRGNCSLQDVVDVRSYLKSLGVKYTG